MPVSHILTIPHTQQYHGPILAPAGIAATIAGGIIDSSQFAGQPVRHSQLSSSANEEGSLNIVETKAGQSVQSTPAPESKPARRKSPLHHLLADGGEPPAEVAQLRRRVDEWETACLHLREELGVVPGYRGFDTEGSRKPGIVGLGMVAETKK